VDAKQILNIVIKKKGVVAVKGEAVVNMKTNRNKKDGMHPHLFGGCSAFEKPTY